MFFAVKNADISALDSLLVFVVGIVMVFLALAIIIFVVLGYVGVFKLADKAKQNGNAPMPTEAVETNVPIETNDEEVVAAITAAVALVMASESPTGEVAPFRVKSILRKK